MIGVCWGVLVVSESKRLLAENLTRIRKERGLTQDALAKAINVTPSFISHLENPESHTWAGDNTLDSLVRALQCRHEDLQKNGSDRKLEPLRIPTHPPRKVRDKKVSLGQALKVVNQHSPDLVIKRRLKKASSSEPEVE